MLIILKKMEEKLPEGKIILRYKEMKENMPEKKKVLEELEAKLLQIEICNKGKNQILYFPNHPIFDSLSGQLRDEVMYEVVRFTRRDKIVSLFKFYGRISS